MTTLYGIPNCDTIRKARKWLDENHVEYRFHDFRKNGVDEKQLRKWAKSLGWELLLNRRGTTWRKLDDAQKSGLDTDKAVRLMLEQPALIKRPVLELNKTVHVGFGETEYKKLFS